MNGPFRGGHLEERRARVETAIRALVADDVDLVIAHTAHARRARRHAVVLVAAAILGLGFGAGSPRKAYHADDDVIDEIEELRASDALCESTTKTQRGDLAACDRRIDEARVGDLTIQVYGPKPANRALKAAFAGVEEILRACTQRAVHVDVTVRSGGSIASVGFDPKTKLPTTAMTCIELRLHTVTLPSWKGDAAQVELGVPEAPRLPPPRPDRPID